MNANTMPGELKTWHFCCTFREKFNSKQMETELQTNHLKVILNKNNDFDKMLRKNVRGARRRRSILRDRRRRRTGPASRRRRTTSCAPKWRRRRHSRAGRARRASAPAAGTRRRPVRCCCRPAPSAAIRLWISSFCSFVCLFFSFWVCVRWCVCFFSDGAEKEEDALKNWGGNEMRWWRIEIVPDLDPSLQIEENKGKKRGNETAHKSKPWDPSTAANPATSLCVSSRGTHTLTHTHTHTPDKITHTRHTKIDGETHRRTLREADTARPTRTHSANLASVAMRWRTEPKTRTWRNGSSPRWLFKVVSWTPSLWFERAPFCCGAAAPLDGHAATVASFAAWNVGPASPSRARPFPSLGPRGRYRVYLRFFCCCCTGFASSSYHQVYRFWLAVQGSLPAFKKGYFDSMESWLFLLIHPFVFQ